MLKFFETFLPVAAQFGRHRIDDVLCQAVVIAQHRLEPRGLEPGPPDDRCPTVRSVHVLDEEL